MALVRNALYPIPNSAFILGTNYAHYYNGTMNLISWHVFWGWYLWFVGVVSQSKPCPFVHQSVYGYKREGWVSRCHNFNLADFGTNTHKAHWAYSNVQRLWYMERKKRWHDPQNLIEKIRNLARYQLSWCCEVLWRNLFYLTWKHVSNV